MHAKQYLLFDYESKNTIQQIKFPGAEKGMLHFRQEFIVQRLPAINNSLWINIIDKILMVLSKIPNREF